MTNRYFHPFKTIIFRSSKATLFTIAFFLLLTGTASAQNFTVTSNGDTHALTPTASALDNAGQVTLRSALEASTAIAGSHTITIPGSITTINLSLGAIAVGSVANSSTNITINGPGKSVLTINQTTTARVFTTGLGAVTTSFNDFTLNYTGPAPGAIVSGGGGAIQSGGNGAVTTINNVAFTNFNIQIGNGGAVLCSASAPNTFTITNCDFTNNTAGTFGGALSCSGNTTGTITNCTFTGNKTTVVGGGTGNHGGALYISGSTGTGVTTVTNCSFVNNSTLTAGTQGGAVANFIGTLNMSFCRFSGNTSASGQGNEFVQVGGTFTHVANINNNWWGVNTPIATTDYVVNTTAGAGTINLTKYLQLKSSAAPATICTNGTATVTASFLSNSAGETVTTANISKLLGLPISFSATSGTLSGAQATIQNSGTATVAYTATASGTGTVNAVVDNVPANDATAKASMTINAETLATGNTVTQNVGVTNNTYYTPGGCTVLCKVAPDGGANQVSGSITSRVWVDGTLPHMGGQPYVRRHYEITPATNPNGATAIVTLYFSQAEFNEFNADANSTLDLPAGAGDAAGIAHIRIAKYSGSSSNGSGVPNTYPGPASVIIPSSSVYNGTLGRWEITFNVAGFSGFILQTSTIIIPVKLISFTGTLKNKTTVLSWKTGNADASVKYELQRSFTGYDFKTVNTQQGDTYQTSFSYDDPIPAAALFYYRLAMKDADGTIAYSNIITIHTDQKPGISIYPNPAKRGSRLKITMTDLSVGRMEIISAAGKIIYKAQSIADGSFSADLPANTAEGIYFVKIYSAAGVAVRKIYIE